MSSLGTRPTPKRNVCLIYGPDVKREMGKESYYDAVALFCAPMALLIKEKYLTLSCRLVTISLFL